MAGIFNHSAQDTFTVDTGPQGGGGGGVSTPVFPENNAQISPSSPEIFLSAPWNYLLVLPKCLKIIQLLPSSTKVLVFNYRAYT